MQNQFFKDLIVIELASVLAGPAVGMFFAELGAKVIKIENKHTGGDVTRKWKLPGEDVDSPYSAYYHCTNWNKEVQLLDLKNMEDRAIVHDLVRKADVVISNFHEATAQKLGMDSPSLRALNPQLIYAQLNAYADGDTAPAFDVILQAEAGFLYMTGEPDRPLVRMPVALIDLISGHQLKEAVLLALIHRMRTGEGSYVSASLFESAVASLANQATNWLMAGHIPQRMGSRHPNIVPYGDAFICKDGKLLILAVGTAQQFKKLCACLGKPQIAEDKRFNTNAARVKHRDELIALLTPLFHDINADVILKQLKSNSVPAAGVYNMQEVFEQPLAQNMILEEPLPNGNVSKRVKTVAFHLKK